MPATKRREMGAIPHADGVTFRVWAPHAARVHIAGTFNEWSASDHPLEPEGEGVWAASVPGAHVGDQYKFVITNKDTGAVLWKNDPYAQELTHSAGNSIVSKPGYQFSGAAFAPPARNELVIYELHVGTFSFDPASAAGRGTFRSVAAKLDYFVELGVNAIEVMASGEFPTDISWGYNPSYIFAIESSYGGPNAFREFVEAAHRKGIAVIFDVVYNHLGPGDLDLWQFDGWAPDGMGGIYFYNDWRGKTPWGKTRPDYRRPEVRQYLKDNALRWLQRRRVDGLRWDATGYIRNVDGKDDDPGSDLPEGFGLVQEINREIARMPGKLSIAEDMQENEVMTQSAEAQGAGFDAQWGASFHHALRAALIEPNDEGRDLVSICSALEQAFNGDAFQRVIYTESHDEVANGHSRIPEEIWPGRADSYYSQKRSTLGAALVFTAPGIPMIFQGQEFLENGYFRDTVELDWSKAERHKGIVALYRDLIRLRRNLTGTTAGLTGQGMRIFHVSDGDKVVAFHRWSQGGPRDDVVVVVNLCERSHGRYRTGFPRGGAWKVRFNSDWVGYSPDFDNHPNFDAVAEEGEQDGLPYGGEFALGAYSAMIFSQDE